MSPAFNRILAIRAKSPKSFDLAAAFLCGCALTGLWWIFR